MNKYNLALILTAIFWGFGYIAVDITITYIPIFTLLFIRFFFASLIIFLIARKTILRNLKPNLKYGIILGILLGASFIVQTIGLEYTTASNNAFITSTNVIMVPILLTIFFKQRLKLNVIIGSIIMLIGITFITGFIDNKLNFGDLLTFISAILFALHIIYIEKYVTSKNLIPLVFLQQFVASLICLILAFTTHSFDLSNIDKVIYPLLYLIIFATTITFFLQNYALTGASSTSSSIILSSEALFATIGSIFILDEHINLQIIIGFALMFFAIVISQLNLSEKNE